MTTPNRIDLDRVHALMMAALDNECTEAERQELETLLANQPELVPEWTRLRRLKEVTMTMTVRQPPEEVWDRYWVSVYNRAERGMAWLLISAGGIILAIWGLWSWMEHVFGDTGIPLVIRAAIAAVGAGLVILAASVLRERWFTHRRDPYSKEVTR